MCILIKVFVIIFSATCASSMFVRECEDYGAELKPILVELSDCFGDPCTLKRGTRANLTVNFEAPRDLMSLEYGYIIEVFGVEIEYPIENPDACDKLVRTGCPLEEGQRAAFKTEIEVYADFPYVSADISFQLTSELDKRGSTEMPIVCFKVKVILE